MNYPLVSVVIPAYNASNYLAEAIDSALAQTYKNIEIIVVNDGSSDNGATERVAHSYGDKIRYFHKENGGCASALNFGIDRMRGEWFSWLSHDDLYCPDKTKYMLDVLEKNKLNPENTVLVCDTILINEDGRVVPCPFKQTRGLLPPEAAFVETLVVKTFNGSGMLIPKNIIDSTGRFITDYKHQLDREYWMRIAMKGYSFYVVDIPLVKSRVHNKQVTVQQKNLLYEEEETLIKSYTKIIEDDSASAAYTAGLCCFAYKRKHFSLGKSLKENIKNQSRLSFDLRVKLLKYDIYGRLLTPVGNLYRKIIRK